MAKITIESSIEIAVPREVVFRYVANWQNAPRYTPNVAELRQVGEVGYGLGTRLLGRTRFKGFPLESVSEVVEFVENERIVCQTVTGVESSNSWLFAGDGNGTTLTAIVAYRLPKHILGDVAARMASRDVVESVTASLVNLKRILETTNVKVARKDG